MVMIKFERRIWIIVRVHFRPKVSSHRPCVGQAIAPNAGECTKWVRVRFIGRATFCR